VTLTVTVKNDGRRDYRGVPSHLQLVGRG